MRVPLTNAGNHMFYRHPMPKSCFDVAESIFGRVRKEDGLRGRIRIGMAHHRHRVPPHLYMAGYSFFLSALLKRLATRFQSDPQLPLRCEAVTKIVGLDTDLAMSVYVREVWREAAVR